MLLRVWQRLLAEGVILPADFMLVLVGRRGWMNEETQYEIDRACAPGGSVLHLEQVGDAELADLYAHAAFCLYPSLYEGFGLPVVEAFAHGTPVICSNGGSLAEVSGGLAPTLDPENFEQWYGQTADWILFPEHARGAAGKIKAEFYRRSWRTVAEDILSAATALRHVQNPCKTK